MPTSVWPIIDWLAVESLGSALVAHYHGTTGLTAGLRTRAFITDANPAVVFLIYFHVIMPYIRLVNRVITPTYQ